MPITAANFSHVLAGTAAIYRDNGQFVIKPVDRKALGFRLVAWIVDLGNSLGRNWLSSQLPLCDLESILKALSQIERHQDKTAGLQEAAPEDPARVETLAKRFKCLMPAASTQRLGLAERIDQGQCIAEKLHNTTENARTLYDVIQSRIRETYPEGTKIPARFSITTKAFIDQLAELPEAQRKILADHASVKPADGTETAAKGALEANLKALDDVLLGWMKGRNEALFRKALDTQLFGRPMSEVDRDTAWSQWQALCKKNNVDLSRRPLELMAATRFIQRHQIAVRTAQIGLLLQDSTTDLMRNAGMAKANPKAFTFLGINALSDHEQKFWFDRFWDNTSNSEAALRDVLGGPARKALGRDAGDARLKDAAALLKPDCEQRFNTLAAQARGTEPLGAHLTQAAQQARQAVIGGGLALTVRGLATIDRLGAERRAMVGSKLLKELDTQGLKARLASFVKQALLLAPDKQAAYVLQQIDDAAKEAKQQAAALQSSLGSAYPGEGGALSALTGKAKTAMGDVAKAIRNKTRRENKAQ